MPLVSVITTFYNSSTTLMDSIKSVMSSDFDDFDHDFRRDNDKEIRVGLVGNAKCQLFSQRLCVDYAVKWFERKRR